MSRSWFVGAVVVSVVVGAVAWVNAGSLTPPPGGVNPTMHTLDDIYNAVGQVNQCGCSWDSQRFSASTEVIVFPAGTSGVLHSVVLPPTSSSQNGTTTPFRNANGTITLVEVTTPGFTNGADGTKVLVLDMRFSDGLRLGPNGSTLTILYKLD